MGWERTTRMGSNPWVGSETHHWFPQTLPALAPPVLSPSLSSVLLTLLIKSLWCVLGSSFNSRLSVLASVSATKEKFSLSFFFFYFIASLLWLTFLISDVIFNLPFNLGLGLLLLCSAVPSLAVVAIR